MSKYFHRSGMNFFSYLQFFLVFEFLSFHLEFFIYYSIPQDCTTFPLTCFLPAYLLHFLRPKAVWAHHTIPSTLLHYSTTIPLLFFQHHTIPSIPLSNTIFSTDQTDFRPGRSTLGQMLYLSQFMSDGFNKL